MLYNPPAKVYFKYSCLELALVEAAQGRSRALIVVDDVCFNSEVYTNIVKYLASRGCAAVACNSARPMTEDALARGLEMAKGSAYDVIIGFGMVHAMSAAKLIRHALATGASSISHADVAARDFSGSLSAPAAAYLILVPATAGAATMAMRDKVMAPGGIVAYGPALVADMAIAAGRVTEMIQLPKAAFMNDFVFAAAQALDAIAFKKADVFTAHMLEPALVQMLTTPVDRALSVEQGARIGLGLVGAQEGDLMGEIRAAAAGGCILRATAPTVIESFKTGKLAAACMPAHCLTRWEALVAQIPASCGACNCKA
jgi:alcohol dehydrogenase class IV